MDRIRPWLCIGDFTDILNRVSLERQAIQAMLQLDKRVEQAGIDLLHLPVEDFAPLRFDLLEQGVAYFREQKKQDRRTLVACEMGINRSTAYCAAVLKEEEGMSLLEAFKEIKRKHPQSLPHEPVWISLCEYYKEETPYIDLLLMRV